MFMRIGAILLLMLLSSPVYLGSDPVDACCPAPRFSGQPVVNADQTVIIIWDAAAKMHHFIRQASFKSDADDFGFLIPSPSELELNESGDAAFPYLAKLTAPQVKNAPRSSGIMCGSTLRPEFGAPVTLLQEKVVAGFQTAVLETKSSVALVQWLKENGYVYSPEIEAWAKPYVEAGWKITALKVAKSKEAKSDKNVAAPALRMSFKTDQPLFPYREPDYKDSAKVIGAKSRMLRIYLIAEARYDGGFPYDFAMRDRFSTPLLIPNYTGPWTGRVAWAGKIASADRAKVLEQLNLPGSTGPAEWWLTEFEDNWAYKLAPQDVYFRRAHNQETVKRPPIYNSCAPSWPTDVSTYALAALVVMPALVRLRRRRDPDRR